MKPLQFLRNSILLSSVVVILGAAPGYASTGVYQPRTTTRQWRKQIADAPVKEIHVYVRRASGGTDTFFNMRFGRNGHTFDGRRVYLKHGDMERASWYLNGRSAGGEELILNSYNGSVHVEKVEVVYAENQRQHSEHYRDAGHDRRGDYGGGYDDYRRGDYEQPRHEPRYQTRSESRYQPRVAKHQNRNDRYDRNSRRDYDRYARRDTVRRVERQVVHSSCGSCACGQVH